ncbi:AfsR/SARP family transcriptional regulator [Szabonella alba]|uniref:DNA-binding transcriptional activator of the SARP family n=1 Tax=Szabonella alba TaxID=2804194 RepID=A0A8K0V653_9RHOB|nr:hypothetical protein [Szabonella alba]MBL4916088.1 hypothetical protein [Szabonella alba]
MNAERAPEPAVVELGLYGPFTLRSLKDGQDLSLRPHKSRAILAMLALAPDQRRSRRWIEERLWSDRGPQQAAGSLRQALVDLRKALGAHDDILIADREWLSLHPGALRLCPAAETGGELLEGVSVRDPAFLRWREAEHRAASGAAVVAGLIRADVTPAGEPVTLRCTTANLPGTGSGIVAEIISARIAADIAEHLTACTIAPNGGGTVRPAADLEINCNVIEDNGICLAFIKIVHLASGRVLYSRDCRFTGTATALAGSEALVQTAWEAAERTVARVPHVLGVARNAPKSAALGQLALHKMFSFNEVQLAEADRLMEQAWEVEGNTVHLAWRGLLQMVKAIELGQARKPELHDAALSLTAHAMERQDGNATVKALVSQTRAMLFGDAVAAGQAALAALEENPRNPFALQAMAVAKMLAGDGEEAYRMSALGRSHASRSTFRHWWDAHHATVCVATGRLPEAIRAAEAAAFAAPSLRPAYRYLLSLYAHQGDLDRANSMKERLEEIEPGFTLDRMLGDPDYPVRTLRSTGLLGQLRKLM